MLLISSYLQTWGLYLLVKLLSWILIFFPKGPEILPNETPLFIFPLLLPEIAKQVCFCCITP